MINKQLFILVVMTLLFSCSETPISSRAEMDTYYGNNKDTYTRTKQIKDITLKATFLSQEYLALQAWGNPSSGGKTASFDSLLALHQESATFLVEVKPKDAENLLKRDVYDQDSYNQRIYALGFSMSEYFLLAYQDKTIEAAIVNADYAMLQDGSIRFLVQFPVSPADKAALTENAQDFQLSYEDPFWGLGVNHFRFNSQKIFSHPTITLSLR